MKRTAEQTRDLILINIMASLPPTEWTLHAFVMGMQLMRAEPRLAEAIIEASVEPEHPDAKAAVMAGIEQSIAELRDGTEMPVE